MSFKQNDTIHLGNYEEFFVLYMDNELNAAQRAEVDAFVLRHPQLAEELDLLMGTKLSPEQFSFANKEDLLSPAMKGAAVDEALLLYVDDELPAAEKAAVAQRIKADKDYTLQHSLLLQTKLDADEKILHPNKKELYRRTERVVAFKVWMRIAAAVLVLLLGTLFFALNGDKPSGTDPVTVQNGPAKLSPPATEAAKATERAIQTPPVANTETVRTEKSQGQSSKQLAKGNETKTVNGRESNEQPSLQNVLAVQRSTEAVAVNERFSTPPSIKAIGLNETLTHRPVTSGNTPTYNGQNDPTANPEAVWAVENNKKAPARGFFRKVSRFIERKTGIGTVNDDNELLIGAVALKLK